MVAPSLTRSDHRASGLEALTKGFRWVMISLRWPVVDMGPSQGLAGFTCFWFGGHCQQV